MLDVLEQAQKIVKDKWPRNRKWKVALVIGLIILSILGVIALSLWLLGKLIKGLTVGGFRNRSLYMPRTRHGG